MTARRHSRFSLRALFGRRWRRQDAPPSLRDHAGWDKRLIQQLSRTRLPSWRQIRHLPEVLSSNDTFRLRFGGFLFAAGLAIIGVRFYYAHTEMAPAVGGEIIEAVVGTPRSLNPVLSQANDVDNDLTRLAFSRLFSQNGEGEVVPDLVESHEISEDLKTYVLRLRENVKWHDGQAFTADDVLFTIGLIQDPAWKSPLHVLLKDAGVERVDDRTLRIALKEPFARFLPRLTFGILPKHVWKDVAPQNALQAEANLKPIGSGPFKFSEMKRDKRGFMLSYTLERNADYYAKPAHLETITFKFYPDYQAALEALRKRQVTSLSFIPHDMRKEVRALSGVVPISLELPQYNAVFFNQRQNDVLKDREVRRALIMSADKGRIVFDVLDGDGRALSGPALPGAASSASAIPFNLTEAGNLLDELGWKLDPEDGVRKMTTKTGVGRAQEEIVKPLRFGLTVVDQPESLNVAAILKNGWQAIGADVEITAVPASEIHRTVIKPRTYEALLYGQLLGADSDPSPFWHSSQAIDPGLNLAMFSNREADEALEAAQRMTDPESRRERLSAFLDLVARELPAAFLYSPTYTYPLADEIKGFEGTRVSNPSDRFASVTAWYVKMRRVWKK